ncbi:unnamed protein product, partial [Mesorhabditis belari]|uniref:Uncharacterized protein n=1 Tax=Mesorhabditis belari TaxID=2138241 RepID=A0AAF3EX56_9BILA
MSLFKVMTLVAAYFLAIKACAPDVNDLATIGSATVTFQPSASWTWDATNAGTPGSQAEADANINDDLELAFYRAVAKNGVNVLLKKIELTGTGLPVDRSMACEDLIFTLVFDTAVPPYLAYCSPITPNFETPYIVDDITVVVTLETPIAVDTFKELMEDILSDLRQSNRASPPSNDASFDFQ